MKGKCKIIFVVEQQGGFDIFSPVISGIKKDKKFLYILFSDNQRIYDQAREQKIKYSRLVGPSISKLKEIIQKENPDIVFTDTSEKEFGLSIDKKFINIAKELRKPTISIVDSWMSYRERFGKKLEYLPNKIFVIDEKMEDDLHKIGIPKDKVEITGSPRFDKFSEIKNTKKTKNLIIFNSQPIPKKEKLNEVKIFRDIVKALEKIHPKKKIIITFHPTREIDKKDRNKYDNIIENSQLTITKAGKDEETDKLNRKAELVMGIHSIALFDASLIKKRVLSYQPGKNIKDDKLQSNKYGWSVPVYKKENLVKKIKSLYAKKVPVGKKQRSKYILNNSTQKVIKKL
ncbi:hypothetical protein KKD91_03180 [Patescibacteria group bacterium]|nr:hypothetical protein [Patescibacteria group bacterium]MCG2699922.1 hypothetical protein [Candidatus Parcubacteria bacterium]